MKLMLEASEIEVGKQYVMVESPFYAAVVSIVEDKSGADTESKRSKEWVGWKVRIEKTLSGIEQEPGSEFEVGWDEKHRHYSPVEFYQYEESEQSEGAETNE
ncbi:hypothetical protein KIH86_23025 [Paenibacillus sp. HN-1]|uniref:hypothetical protein n=1 Tax=Paenibacillus TaxID=44249 RepID=UPI001CA91E46|nr:MULTISPECIES: hypothetical protein [Paenibacillus]MBY9081029.1 hypothetical protein [Paenibacillus sp. CGMCC 1.18879]MBY9087066.1 hypothetical protein [Paenibacillus sinensis]